MMDGKCLIQVTTGGRSALIMRQRIEMRKTIFRQYTYDDEAGLYLIVEN